MHRQLLIRTCKVPSGVNQGERASLGKKEVSQGPISDMLKDLGFSVDRWEPSRKDFSGYEAFLPEGGDFSGRPNVVGRLKGSGRSKKKRETLGFNGHIDVVPAGDGSLWKYGPWAPKVRDGKSTAEDRVI